MVKKIKNKRILAIVFFLFVFSFGGFSFVKAQLVLQISATSCPSQQGEVWLNWNDQGSYTYTIQRRVLPLGSFGFLASTTSLSYIDQTVISDLSYEYRVSTSTVWSNTVPVAALYCATVLNQPDGSCPGYQPRIALQWAQALGTTVNRYEIWRRQNGGSYIFLASTTPAVLTYYDGPDIAGGDSYDYYIKTYWNSGTRNSLTKNIPGPSCAPNVTFSTTCESAVPGGPSINSSWDSLYGIKYYNVYREGPGDPEHFLASTTLNYFKDFLVNTFASGYHQFGTLYYTIQPVWPNGSAQSEKSLIIFRCSPFLTIENNCKEGEGPAMLLSWTKTQGANQYNIFRATGSEPFGSDPLYQISSNQLEDYLGINPECSDGICTFRYRIDAQGPGINESSVEVSKTIDCATVENPSPAPVMNDPSAYCVSNDSRISLSWSPSNYTNYYILYRNTFTTTTWKYPFTVDNNVTGGNEYTYWVDAIGRIGSQPTTSVNQKTITAENCTNPSGPSVSYEKGCFHTRPYIDLSWSVIFNARSYLIYRGTSINNLTIIGDPLPGNQSFYRDDDAALEPSEVYYYKVVAVGPLGTVPGESSISPAQLTLSCLPSNPALSLNRSCNGSNSVINLSWVSDTVNAMRYDIYRNNSFRVTIDDPAVNTYQENVEGGMNYEYRVESIGWDARKSMSSASITSYYCLPPGPFSMYEPSLPIACNDAYPSTTISWGVSSNANYYNLNLYRYNPGTETIVETTAYLSNFFSNNADSASSPFINKGLGYSLKLSSSSNQSVIIPYNESFYFPPGQDFSLSFWVKFNAYPTENYYDFIGYFGNTAAEGYWFFGMEGPDNGVGPWNQLRFRFYDNSIPQNSISCNCGWVPALNKWYNIIATVDRDGYAVIYSNGVETCRCGVSSINDIGTNKPFKINNISYTDHHNINIDHVKLYDKVLNSTEIQQHVSLTYDDSNYNNLRLFLRFDEGTGAYVSDSSNYRNDGTIINSPLWERNGPQCNTKHRWQAKACANGCTFADNKVPSDSAQAVMPSCPPSKPGLSVMPFCQVLDSRTSLSWSYSINATVYEIYRNGAFQASTSNSSPGNPSSRTLIQTGLNPGASYNYYVRAKDSVTGFSKDSDIITINAVDCNGPSQPQNLILSASCFENKPRVALSWEGTSNTEYYKIFRKTGSQPYSYIASSSATSTINAYPSVSVNNTYIYYIIAHGPGGDSIPSATSSIFVDYCPVSSANPISIFTDCDYTTASATTKISWRDATNFNTKEYRIYRNIENNTTSADLITTIPTTSSSFSRRTYDDNSGLSNQAYYYWVRTVGIGTGQGYDIFSDPVLITTNKCQTPVMAPSLSDVQVQCEAGKPNHLITWQPGDSNTISYKIQRNDSYDYYFTRQSSFLEKNKESYSLNFDNLTGPPVGYFIVSPSNSLKIDRTPFSIETWVYPQLSSNGTNTYMSILSRLNGESSYNALHVEKITGNNTAGRITSHFYFIRENDDGTFQKVSYPRAFSSALVFYNQWNHVVFTWDGRRQRVYVNGALKETYTISDRIYSLATATDPWSLRIGRGAGDDDWDERFNGKIDELRIYGRALSSSEITDHYIGQYKNELYLKAVWHFDESGIIRKTPDSSGYGNHGTVYGASPVAGKIGNAFSFNRSNQNYIDLAKGGDIGTNSFTWEAWIKTNPNSSAMSIIRKKGSALPQNWVGDLRVVQNSGGNANKILFYITENIYRYSFAPVADGNWHHIVATCDRSSGTARPMVYIDGVASNGDRAGFCYQLPEVSNGGDLFLANYSSGNYFNGLIDEVRIYNRYLTQAEASEHFNGNFNDETGLSGFWRLDEGKPVNSKVYDSSGNNNDGIYWLSSNTSAIPPEEVWFELPDTAPTYVPSLSNNVLYEYKVKSFGINTSSDFSNSIIVTPNCGPVIDSFTIATTCEDGGSVSVIDWTTHNSSAGVKISRFDDYGAEDTILEHGPSSGTVEDKQTTENTHYIYRIIAYGEDGEEVFSDRDVTSKNCGQTPAEPIIMHLNYTCETSANLPRINLDWSTSCDITIEYQVYQATSSQEPDEPLAGDWPGPISSGIDCEVSNAKFYLSAEDEGTNFWYRIKALGEGGGVSFSSSASALVPNCENMSPRTPVLSYDSIISTGDGISINLSWTDAGNETEYRIYRCFGGVAYCSDIGNYLLMATRTADVLNWQEENQNPPNPDPEDIIDESTYYYFVEPRNPSCILAGDCPKSNQPGPYIPIAIPGAFQIAGIDQGSKIRIDLIDPEPATTAAAGLAFYTFYRGSVDTQDPNASTWNIFNSECMSTTSLYCIDYDPDPNYRFYMVRAICSRWEQTPNFSQSNNLDLFIFSPKWKEIPTY